MAPADGAQQPPVASPSKPVKTVGRGLRSPPLQLVPTLPSDMLNDHERAKECYGQWNDLMHSVQARWAGRRNNNHTHHHHHHNNNNNNKHGTRAL